jgi:hypothetical protein
MNHYLISHRIFLLLECRTSPLNCSTTNGSPLRGTPRLAYLTRGVELWLLANLHAAFLFVIHCLWRHEVDRLRRRLGIIMTWLLSRCRNPSSFSTPESTFSVLRNCSFPASGLQLYPQWLVFSLLLSCCFLSSKPATGILARECHTRRLQLTSLLSSGVPYRTIQPARMCDVDATTISARCLLT